MKPLHIEFMEDHRWRWIWGGAVLATIALAGSAGWQWWLVSNAAREAGSQLATAKQQVAQLTASQEVPADPKEASARQAAHLLLQDLNAAFATVENLKEPNARLRNLSLDNASATLRLEYELDSMARASSVTAVLNAGHEGRPWVLESVGSANAGNAHGGLASSMQTVRAYWSAPLGKL